MSSVAHHLPITGLRSAGHKWQTLPTQQQRVTDNLTICCLSSRCSPLPALSAFMTAPAQDSPRQCCFTSPLDAATGAQLCMAPTESVAQEVTESPVTQAAAYQLPACGYTDPLAAYGEQGLQAQLGLSVDVSSRFCLEVSRRPALGHLSCPMDAAADCRCTMPFILAKGCKRMSTLQHPSVHNPGCRAGPSRGRWPT